MSEDDQLRRLLAGARHTEPIPPDVVERLDGVLADLRHDRPIRPTVSDLAAARRRRRARTLLIAASAVVVAGVAFGQLRGATSGSDGDSASSADAGGGDAAAERHAADGNDLPLVGDAPAFDRAERVAPDDFGVAARRLRHERSGVAAELDSVNGSSSPAKFRCVGRGWGAGEVVPVRYDGHAAVFVYRTPRGDTQVVDLYLCGAERATRSITLPAR